MKNLKLGFYYIIYCCLLLQQKSRFTRWWIHFPSRHVQHTQSLLGKLSTHSSHSFALCKLVLSYAPSNFTTQFCTGKTQHVDSPQKAKKSIMFNICVYHNSEGCLVFETVTTRNPIQKFCYRKQYKWFWKNKTSQGMYENLFKKLWM